MEPRRRAALGAGCVLLAYAFSVSLTTVGHYLTFAPLALVAAVLVALVVMHLRRTNRRRPARSDDAPHLETASP